MTSKHNDQDLCEMLHIASIDAGVSRRIIARLEHEKAVAERALFTLSDHCDDYEIEGENR